MRGIRDVQKAIIITVIIFVFGFVSGAGSIGIGLYNHFKGRLSDLDRANRRAEERISNINEQLRISKSGIIELESEINGITNRNRQLESTIKRIEGIRKDIDGYQNKITSIIDDSRERGSRIDSRISEIIEKLRVISEAQ